MWLRLCAVLSASLLMSVSGAVIAPSSIRAQDSTAEAGSGDAPAGDAPAEDPSDLAGGSDPSVELTDQQALTAEQMGVEDTQSGTDPREDPNEGYMFLGLGLYAWIVPSFILELFTDEAPGAVNPFIGAEFTYRKDGFDIIGSVYWAGGFVEGPFRGSGDPLEDTEIIDSNLQAILLTARFMWSTDFNEYVSLQYGVGVGLGFVFGDLVRTEAYPDANNEFQPCEGPRTPNERYCDATSVGDGENGGHFGVKARNWGNGGNVPIVVPWLYLPTIAVRIKPIKQMMIRVEGGVGLGFFVGGNISYGF
ncbi:MAG: hypothetical protein AAGF12_32385 [Myxococcota bacterium]